MWYAWGVLASWTTYQLYLNTAVADAAYTMQSVGCPDWVRYAGGC